MKIRLIIFENFFLSNQGFFLILSFLILAYALKSAEIEPLGLDPVLMAWGMVSVFAVVIARKRAFFYSLLFFAYLFPFYVLGLYEDGFRAENVSLIRIFLSFSIFAGMAAFHFTATGGYSKGIGLYLQVVVLVLLSGWIFFIYREQAYVAYAAREYGAENYLTLSDLVAAISFIAISDIRNSFWLRGAWVLVGGVACMLLGSRATIVFFFVSMIGANLFMSNLRLGAKLAMVVALAAFMVASVSVFVGAFDETVTYRVLSLENLSGDASLEMRQSFLFDYLSRIRESPSCLVFPCFPEPSEYVHNFLSIPQYFGIAGFVILFWGGGVMVVAGIKGWRPPVLGLFIFSIMQILFARAWVSFVFPFLVGYVLSAHLFLKSKNRSEAWRVASV